jgi:toxin ParE1/3/4
MSASFLIEPEAELDIAEGYRWYEEHDAGLGSEFLRSIESCFAAIQRTPLLYRTVHASIRRAFVRRFPYGVFYVVDDHGIAVIAVCHVRRDPRVWQTRV